MPVQGSSRILAAFPLLQYFGSGEVDKGKEISAQNVTHRVAEFYLQAKTLRQCVQNASNGRIELMTSIVSFGVGMKALCSGDIITGGIAAAGGAKGVWDLFDGEFNEGLQKLLSDIGADVGMIQDLEESNFLLGQDIEKDLERAKKVILLQSDLEKSINLKETEGAQAAYAATAELFQSIQIHLAESRNHYEQCSDLFGQIYEIVRGENLTLTVHEQLEKLDALAHAILNTCRLGKEYLSNASANLENALGELSRASKLNVIEDNSYIEECGRKSNEIQKNMKEIYENSDSIMKLIEELKGDVVKAKEEAASKSAFSKLAIGLSATAVMAPSLGLMSGAAVGFSAMCVLCYSSTIPPVISKVYQWAWGSPIPESRQMKPHQLIEIQFNKEGYFLQQRFSLTTGIFKVNLGHGLELTYPFNLDDRNMIAKKDLLSLVNIMYHHITEGNTPQRCVDILCKLETILIERGGWYPNVEGLINKNSPTYAVISRLKQLCIRAIRAW